jgi:hypothetical protein
MVMSVVLGVFSFYPVTGTKESCRTIIDDTFILSRHEIYRQGLGSFRGNENITLVAKSNASYPFKFELITYNGTQYTALATEFTHSFATSADYYEAVFIAKTSTSDPIDPNLISLQVYVQSPETFYPFSWLATPARALFVASWAVMMLLLLRPEIKSSSSATMSKLPALSLKSRRTIQSLVFISLVFWFALLVLNNYPLGTFENWYTDNARHPYTATLFTKVGFSVFDTPLGLLSSGDSSFYKYVTWPEMPHLYPVGSILLFLPFGVLLEAGMAQVVVLKFEIVLFLIASHACLYYFLKKFWNQNLNSGLKAVALYIFYIVLVVYAANGQFDAVAFIFSLFGVILFLDDRYDFFLLFVAIAVTFKYQAGIFLAPLVLVGLIRLFRQYKPSTIVKNKTVLAATSLVIINLITASLSMPYLANARPEFILNGVNAFSLHGQIPWTLQSFTVLLFLSATLIFVVHVMDRSRLIALFAIFMLLPCLTMPYFQPWYLPLFFVYLLIPQPKRCLKATVIWLIFVALVLSFGGLSYNPIFILDRIRSVLTFPPLGAGV